jgi:hypothetical protein
VLRSLPGFDEKEGSITFAGDIHQGSRARLMQGTIEHLISTTLATAQDEHTELDRIEHPVPGQQINGCWNMRLLADPIGCPFRYTIEHFPNGPTYRSELYLESRLYRPIVTRWKQ